MKITIEIDDLSAIIQDTSMVDSIGHTFTLIIRALKAIGWDEDEIRHGINFISNKYKLKNK